MKIFKCIFCGYEKYGMSAPKSCPVCYASINDFEEVQGNYYNYIPLLKYRKVAEPQHKVFDFN